jgi:hypothetical protein
LNQIDIGITNHDGKLYKFNEIGRFHLVLVFEVELNDEISKEFIKKYNEEGSKKPIRLTSLSLGNAKTLN